jgi:hypothetical protein
MWPQVIAICLCILITPLLQTFVRELLNNKSNPPQEAWKEVNKARDALTQRESLVVAHELDLRERVRLFNEFESKHQAERALSGQSSKTSTTN